MDVGKKLKVLVVGLGNMGMSHALAYHTHSGYELSGLVNRSSVNLPNELEHYPWFSDYATALSSVETDVVSINTNTDNTRRLCYSRI